MNSYCFCGLALGKKYRLCAIDVAQDLEKYHPGIQYLILTDDPSDFRDLTNVIALKHVQDSIMFPYNDRRFAIEKALERYDMAIQIDTDIRLLKPLIFPEKLDNLDGIFATIKNLKTHLTRYQPENIPYYERIAKKLDIDFESAPYIGEFVFSVGKNQKKEQDFIHYWGIIAKYLEIHRIHGADGPVMGLAVAKAGLLTYPSEWPNMIEHEFVEHLKFSSGKKRIQKSQLEKLQFRLAYHYRLNKERLLALKDFNFYYTD
jgi:hypothetical protein